MADYSLLIWYLSHGNAEYRKEAQQHALALGVEILPELLKAIDEELHKKPPLFREEREQEIDLREPLLRLVDYLATFEHPSSLLPLAQAVAQNPEKRFQKPFAAVLQALEKRAESADIAGMLATLQQHRGARQRLAVAQALVRIAERDPKSELRAALPLLSYKLALPFEFIALRKRLKTALGDESLPIPAKSQSHNEALPVPAQNEDSDAS